MQDHKFKTGQKVKLDPTRFASNRHPFFTVLHLLPPEQGINQYRIKSVWDGRECVVRENELGKTS
jgi:hypothetical protein